MGYIDIWKWMQRLVNVPIGNNTALLSIHNCLSFFSILLCRVVQCLAMYYIITKCKTTPKLFKTGIRTCTHTHLVKWSQLSDTGIGFEILTDYFWYHETSLLSWYLLRNFWSYAFVIHDNTTRKRCFFLTHNITVYLPQQK